MVRFDFVCKYDSAVVWVMYRFKLNPMLDYVVVMKSTPMLEFQVLDTTNKHNKSLGYRRLVTMLFKIVKFFN